MNTLKILIAPDSFKGSISAVGVAEAIEKGILRCCPQAVTVKIPVADGGEGTVEAIYMAAGGELYTVEVAGPLGEPVSAQFLITPDRTAVIEMAQASGLPLVPEGKKNPLLTTTYGTGQLMKAALDKGAARIIIGLGGSATNDGGAGMAQALGARLLDGEGRELACGGGPLSELASVDMSGFDPRIAGTEILVASDVTNPLCGEKGASAVYGPQKGADEAMVRRLDGNLAHFAGVLRDALGVDVKDRPGAGAAGGLGAGLMAFCGARLQPGIDTVLDITGFDGKVKDAQLVITGEGRVDFQSAFGKVPDGIGRRAKKHGVPVAAIGGGIGKGAEALYDVGVECITALPDRPMSLEECMSGAAALLESAAERLMRAVLTGMKMAAR